MSKIRYDLFVGISDKNTKRSNFSLDEIRNDLCKNFKLNKTAFSITNQLGGYVHEDGTYVYEDSIQITIVSEDKNIINEKLIKYLKTKYNQESILLLKKEIASSYN